MIAWLHLLTVKIEKKCSKCLRWDWCFEPQWLLGVYLINLRARRSWCDIPVKPEPALNQCSYHVVACWCWLLIVFFLQPPSLGLMSTAQCSHTLPQSSQGAHGWYVAWSNQKPTKKRNSNLLLWLCGPLREESMRATKGSSNGADPVLPVTRQFRV